MIRFCLKLINLDNLTSTTSFLPDFFIMKSQDQQN